MNFDRRYWILIGSAMACATVSSASTLYLASLQKEHFMECNSVSAACFAAVGTVPCIVLGVLSLLPLKVAVPYLFRQNERLGAVSVLVLSLIVAYTVLDAANNVAAILRYRDIYFLAHAALSTANNVTGTIAGTGESLC